MLLWFFLILLFTGCSAQPSTPNNEVLEVARSGNVADIKKFSSNLNKKNSFGQTPLILACWKQPYNSSLIKYLIDNGADVNSKTYYTNATPLLYMTKYGAKNTEIIRLLISKGADVNAKFSEDWTPLHHMMLISM